MHRSIFIALIVCFAACKNKATKPALTERFEAKYVKLIVDTSKMMLIGNVVISYNDLYVEADSALLEKPKQTVTVFGARKIIFQGKTLEPGENNDTLIYNKAEGTLITN